MNSRVVLSLVLLLVATSVISTGSTASATDDRGPLPNPDRLTDSMAVASYCTWDPVTKQNVCVSDPSEFSQPTSRLDCQKYPNYPNCPRYPNYPVPTSKPPTSQVPNCPKYPYYSNYPNCPNYPYYSNYAKYPYYYSSPIYVYGVPNYSSYPYYYSYPSYGYGDPTAAQTTAQTVTATSYSFVTQTSEVTSIAPPVTVTASATVTTTSTTKDTTAETLYGTLMAVFLALFLATLVLLVGSRYRGSKGSSPQSSQAASARPAQARIATSYRCSACGTDVDLGSKFCGKCGAAFRR
jgi:hypothetical protein